MIILNKSEINVGLLVASYLALYLFYFLMHFPSASASDPTALLEGPSVLLPLYQNVSSYLNVMVVDIASIMMTDPMKVTDYRSTFRIVSLFVYVRFWLKIIPFYPCFRS